MLGSNTELLTQMQVDYQKEQDAGTKTLLYCQNHINVENASYQVENDLYSVQNNDYALDALGYTFQSDLNGATTDVVAVQTNLKELQSAVSANKTGIASPRYTTNDIDTAMSIAQAQADISTKALTDTKAKAAIFDKQAADLAQAAKQFAANFECP